MIEYGIMVLIKKPQQLSLHDTVTILSGRYLDCLVEYNGKSSFRITLGPAYNEQKDAKETAHYKWVLVVTKLFNMVVNDFDAKQ